MNKDIAVSIGLMLLPGIVLAQTTCPPQCSDGDLWNQWNHVMPDAQEEFRKAKEAKQAKLQAGVTVQEMRSLDPGKLSKISFAIKDIKKKRILDLKMSDVIQIRLSQPVGEISRDREVWYLITKSHACEIVLQREVTEPASCIPRLHGGDEVAPGDPPHRRDGVGSMLGVP